MPKLVGQLWQDYAGANAVELVIKYAVSGPGGELWLEELQGAKQFGRLGLVSGEAKARVATGSFYLEYRGKTTTPAEPFALEVTAPVSAAWKPIPALTSGADADVFGIHKVKI